MPRIHIVRQGEHLASIAARYGFVRPAVIWQAPDNAQLRELRESPDVLLPGDEVHIPDAQDGKASVATGQRHRFVLSRAPLRLRLRLLDALGDPIANAACRLVIDGETHAVQSDGDGVIDQGIDARAARATVTLPDGTAYEVWIGHLDPIETPAGVRARLHNLGYNAGDPDAEPDEIDEEAFGFAIALFQLDSRLPVTGECSDDTRAKIRQRHGS